MQKNSGPFRLCLNTAATRELHWQCRTFISRKLMKCYASGTDLAKDMKIPLQKLIDVHDAHAEAFRNSLKRGNEQGPWPGTNGRTSWDECSGTRGCGKCDFRNVLVGSRVAEEPFHVAIVTPVILYCAGGIQINSHAEVVDEHGKGILGLYAAGESTGGIHGKQALSGNLLLDCLVFGRLAAKSACRYIFGEDDEFRPCPLQTFGASKNGGPAWQWFEASLITWRIMTNWKLSSKIDLTNWKLGSCCLNCLNVNFRWPWTCRCTWECSWTWSNWRQREPKQLCMKKRQPRRPTWDRWSKFFLFNWNGVTSESSMKKTTGHLQDTTLPISSYEISPNGRPSLLANFGSKGPGASCGHANTMRPGMDFLSNLFQMDWHFRWFLCNHIDSYRTYPGMNHSYGFLPIPTDSYGIFDCLLESAELTFE